MLVEAGLDITARFEDIGMDTHGDLSADMKLRNDWLALVTSAEKDERVDAMRGLLKQGLM